MEFPSIATFHPRFERELGLLWLEFDHGKANEMGEAQLDVFEALGALVADDDRIRTLCSTSRRVTAGGKPLFIAGANVTERAEWEPARVKRHVVRQRALMQTLRHLPVFHVCLIDGVTLGWGVEYLLTADFTLTTPRSSFGLPETGLGIVPGARGTAELAAAIGPAHALWLGCTGEMLDGPAAVDVGLAQALVDDWTSGQERVRALAHAVVRRSPTAVAAYKRALLAGLGRPEAERLALEHEAYEACVDAGEAAIGRASFEAIRRGEPPAWGPRRAVAPRDP